MLEAPYDFRPVTPADLPMLEGWLRQPHATEWWGDDILASLEEIIEAAESVETEPLIVELEGKALAYLQVYDPHLEDDHPYQDQPFGTLGLDVTIGDAAMLGKGHGSAMVRQITEQLFAEGAPRVIIDPHPDNARAIRAYAKAGFREIDRRHSPYGDVVLMACDPD
ncbi:MAG TPA: GNAT family N-acetyltransferase [Tianweitania sediminis]|nr:GNAT family N-acetyltransferase [Tianweitania sediminis]